MLKASYLHEHTNKMKFQLQVVSVYSSCFVHTCMLNTFSLLSFKVVYFLRGYKGEEN